MAVRNRGKAGSLMQDYCYSIDFVSVEIHCYNNITLSVNIATKRLFE